MNLFVVLTGMTTTLAVAMVVGPPMIRRLMDQAVVPGLNGNHPYERAFRVATGLSVVIALGVSALATITLSWFLGRRAHSSAADLSLAASAVADGRYDIRVSSPGLGKEFDVVAAAFNTMAARLGAVEEARRQMLADLAHEIRTPVSVLEAYMEALEDGVRQLDAETIVTLRQQTGRLARFSVDATALAMAEQEPSAIDARWIELSVTIGAAIDAFTPRYSANAVSLSSEVSPALPQVWADPERLGQVLANLLDNALRHTRAGDDVAVSAVQRRDSVVITVSDSGDGVAPEHLPRLFDRFYRVDTARDRDRGGAGIGLSITKALVEAHGGRIAVHSQGPGAGCTFTVVLPIGAGCSLTAPLAAGAAQVDGPISGSKRIVEKVG